MFALMLLFFSGCVNNQNLENSTITPCPSVPKVVNECTKKTNHYVIGNYVVNIRKNRCCQVKGCE
jgi:uncharacterized protein (DUF1499 family)